MGHHDHDSPEKSSRRNKANKGKRHAVSEHAAATNQRNNESPDR
jgi:hypothetical protein